MKIHSLAESKHSDLYLERFAHCPLARLPATRSDSVNGDKSTLPLLLVVTETKSFVPANSLVWAFKCDEMKVDRQVSAAAALECSS